MNYMIFVEIVNGSLCRMILTRISFFLHAVFMLSSPNKNVPQNIGGIYKICQ